MFEVLYLLVQRDVIDIGADGLSRSCAQPNNFQASPIDLICELVYRNVRRSAYQHLPHFLLDEMVYKGGRSYCLSGSWRALNQSQRSCQSFTDGIHLEMVELWETLDGELLWKVSVDVLILGVVAKDLVENIV